jgi:hypothetical protein
MGRPSLGCFRGCVVIKMESVGHHAISFRGEGVYEATCGT